MLYERSERDGEWMYKGTTQLRKMRKGWSAEKVKKKEDGSAEKVRKKNRSGRKKMDGVS